MTIEAREMADKFGALFGQAHTHVQHGGGGARPQHAQHVQHVQPSDVDTCS